MCWLLKQTNKKTTTKVSISIGIKRSMCPGFSERIYGTGSWKLNPFFLAPTRRGFDVTSSRGAQARCPVLCRLTVRCLCICPARERRGSSTLSLDRTNSESLFSFLFKTLLKTCLNKDTGAGAQV